MKKYEILINTCDSKPFGLLNIVHLFDNVLIAMAKSVKCDIAVPNTDCAYKYCESFVNVTPVKFPDVPVASKWTDRPVFLPAKYATIAEQIANFRVRPDDIWVVTYPKCGTTWTQEMVRMMLSDLDYDQASKETLEERFSFLEAVCMFQQPSDAATDCEFSISSVKRTEEQPSPRFIKTHLPIQLLPKEIWTVRPKIIYTARNPKDTAVSFFHHYRNMHGYLGDIDDFFRAFLADEIVYSPFSDHILNFWVTKDEPNVLFLTYEEMKTNLMEVLLKTQKFLGKSFSHSQLLQLSQHLDVDTMRNNNCANNTTLLKNLSAILGQDDFPDKEFRFVRKGIAGSYRTEMSHEMVRRFDEAYQSFEKEELFFNM